MADRIKGITVVLGGDTTGLNKALSGTNKEIKNTQAQLRDVERLLKLDPTNTTLLEQKQRLLAEAVGETKTKLDTLKTAEKQVQDQFKRGEVSQQQYDALQREIISTKNELGKLENAAKDTNTQIYNIDPSKITDVRTSAKEAREALKRIDAQPVRDVESAAKNAGDALENAGKQASNFGDYLKAEAIIEGAKGIVGAVSNAVEETQEFRKTIGTLETSSAAAGYAPDAMNEILYQAYWALGDTQTAATTTANLQAIGLSQKDLNDMLALSVGAWAKYGDSIPIDGLAESINETVKAGQVTGAFADVLNWGSKEGENFGVTLKANTEANKEWNEAVQNAETAEDFFNLALQDASTEAERANIIMQAMADQGLKDIGDAWYQNNKDIVNANDAQLDYAYTMSEVGERVSPVMTSIKEGGNELLQTMLDVTNGVDYNALAEMITRVFDAISNIILFLVGHKEETLAIISGIAAGLIALKLSAFISDLTSVATGVTTAAETFPKLSSAIGLLTNPIFLISAAVVALVVLIATKGDEIQAILQKVDDFLQGIFLTDWTKIFGPGLGDALNAFFANVKNIWNAVKQIFDGVIDFIRGVFTGDWERAWNGVKSIFSGIFNGLTAIVKAPINGIIGLLNGVIGGINWLIGGLNKISFSLPSWLPAGLGGKSFGINIGTIGKIPYLAKGGILSQGSAVVGEAGPELLTMMGNRAMVQPLTSQQKTTNVGGINMYIYGAPGQDINELADIVEARMETKYQQKAAVYRA
ncbi:hypothetical protein H9X86_08755 [Pseudoflavonifractor capillosus]|uniref:hypothetical protein n=1 Tax=Pseudoflavonifractor capillosus TaxID=106588 RepID=UPI00195D44D1|nr:hypothetical protein [Pseudoflavonifractor capillosus]MBM6897451.1 hypothetical protein [Pseudoflavonifractor capillosus]